MSRATKELTEFASINLHFAQAEITLASDRDSVLRALDHIQQAQACLEIVAAEYETPLDEPEAEAVAVA